MRWVKPRAERDRGAADTSGGQMVMACKEYGSASGKGPTAPRSVIDTPFAHDLEPLMRPRGGPA
jgi:hypothetical protein